LKVPKDIEKLRKDILKIIYPIRPVNEKTIANEDFFHISQRTNAGRSLPPYYLVYFLFVDLLKFKDLGKSDKTAWSIPIDFNGKVFLIEYRKMGVGVFAHDADIEEKEAVEIVKLIQKAIKKAEPYFDFVAQSAVNESEITIINKSAMLYDRYLFLLNDYKKKVLSIENSVDYSKQLHANWMALATIDSFYSWTEHVFVHIAIITGIIQTNKELTDFIKYDWMNKYKRALGLSTKESKTFYDKLVFIKRQLRNFYTHGAFGKEGEAFQFHSATGTVPVQITQTNKSKKYVLNGPPGFSDSDAIQTIESFIEFMWADRLLPAKMYIQESGLPTILPFSSDGTYSNAMRSAEDMNIFIDGLTHVFDTAADMDW
jgi:hypothetical protein